MSNVAFALYKGFLIAKYSETDVRAYRSREYYASNTASYQEPNRELVNQVIDVAGDQGDFSELDYNKIMQVLGRKEIDISGLKAPEQGVYQWGPSQNEGIERAAAYIAGLFLCLEDVDSPDHPIWIHLKEEYKESYRRRARRVIELAQS